MICKFILHLKMKLFRAVRAIKAGIGSAIYHRVIPVLPVYDAFHGFVAAIRTTGNAVRAWPLKKAPVHAPVFSLFTFFADRPTP